MIKNEMVGRKEIQPSLLFFSFLVLLISFLSFSSRAFCEEGIKFSGHFQNFIIFKTDRDFDPSRALYEPWGQTAGVVGTYAEPKFMFNVGENLFAVETLIGFNVWSRNSPIARPDVQGGRQLFLFMRQLYSEINNPFHLKIGYQYFADPLEIFVRHWIGGAKLEFGNFSFFLGQIPDQTREGVEIFSNNFINDTYLFAFSFAQGGFTKNDFIPLVGRGFFAGLYNVFDNSVIRKPAFVSSFVSGYNYETSNFYFIGGIALQGGFFWKSAFRGDEKHLAGALEFRAIKKGTPSFGGELMLLSPDGSRYRDGINTGFIYSGKSMSRTLLLTEDEIIFKSDNIDLNIGEHFSVFRVMRPGLFIFDVWGDFRVFREVSLNPIAGVGLTLDPLIFEEGKSPDSLFLGFELSPVIRYRTQGILFELANIFFIPGKAVGPYFNLINPEKLRPFVYSVEVSLKLLF